MTSEERPGDMTDEARALLTAYRAVGDSTSEGSMTGLIGRWADPDVLREVAMAGSETQWRALQNLVNPFDPHSMHAYGAVVFCIGFLVAAQLLDPKLDDTSARDVVDQAEMKVFGQHYRMD